MEGISKLSRLASEIKYALKEQQQRTPAFIQPLNILCEALGAHSSACRRREPSSFTSATDIASRADTEGGIVRRSL